MKKFLFKTTLFVVGAMLIAQALAFVVTSLQLDQIAAYQLQIKKLLKNKEKINLITIGNSHHMSIDFKSLDQKGYHLWREGGDFFEMKYQLETLLPRLPNNKTVLIAVSYFSFHSDKSARENTKEERIWMYAALPSLSFIEGEFKYFILGKINQFFPLHTIVRPDHWNQVFGRIFIFNKSLRTTNIERGEDGQSLQYQYVGCKYYELHDLIIKTKEIGVQKYFKTQHEALANHPHLTTDAYETVVQMIEYLQERNIRTVFYTPPYFETYTEFYDAETVKLMKSYMEQLQQDYKIEYYDFSTDPEFIHNHRLFVDDDHLNLCGARQFSAKLKEILSENAP